MINRTLSANSGTPAGTNAAATDMSALDAALRRRQLRWQRGWWLATWLVLLMLLIALLFGFSQNLSTAGAAGYRTTLKAALAGSLVGVFSTMFGAFLLLLAPRRAASQGWASHGWASQGWASQGWLDGALSVSGGMMLAAAVFSLLEPARAQLNAAQHGFGLQCLLGLATLAGAWLMAQLERFVPHSHPVAGDNPAVARRVSANVTQGTQRLWLFVGAIALHNLPEGLAVGVSFAGTDLQLGSSVSLAIALQDMPEGFAMALVLHKLQVPLRHILGWSLLAALLEPFGAVLSVSISQYLGTWLALSYPLLLALAAGAMLFVVVHEVIPETQSARLSHAPQQSSLLLLAGFLLMWLLDSGDLAAVFSN